MMPASYSSTFSETGFENLYLHVFLSGKLTICRCRPGLCKNGTIFLCQFPLLISFMFTFARPVRVFFFFFFLAWRSGVRALDFSRTLISISISQWLRIDHWVRRDLSFIFIITLVDTRQENTCQRTTITKILIKIRVSIQYSSRIKECSILSRQSQERKCWP